MRVRGIGQVHERFGPAQADAAAEELVAYMNGALRVYDTVGRTGEDEMLAILPSTGRRQAQRAAERLRRVVEDYRYEHRGGGAVESFALVVGIAAFPLNGPSMKDVLAAARDAMEQAERAGGVVVSESYVGAGRQGRSLLRA